MSFVIRALIFCSLIVIASSGSVKLNKIVKVLENDKNVKNFMSNFKEVGKLGLIMGTSKAAKKMEINILELLRDFIKTIQGFNLTKAVQKFQRIEDTIERDKKSIEILNNAMSLALEMKSLREYRQTLNKMLNDDNTENKISTRHIPKDKKRLMQQLQKDVNSHVEFLRKNAALTMQNTLESIQQKNKKKTMKEKSEISSTPPTIAAVTTTITSINDIFKHEALDLPQLYIRMPIWSLIPNYHVMESFYQRFRRQNEEAANEVDGESTKEVKKEGEEEDFGIDDEEEGDTLSMGGGLVGLIGSLSGGEGGSDVGALVGAISGVITNLFGVTIN